MSAGRSPYDAIARLYDPWSAGVVEDVEFYVEEALASGGAVVELACGTGRIAVPIAKAGVPLIGVDGSEAMLEVAREHAAREGLSLDLRHGDMREPPVSERVPLVLIPFRSLLHMTTEDDRLRALRAARELLLPGGLFAWNAFVFDPHLAAANDGEWQEQNGIRHRVDQHRHDNRIDITLASGDAISLWWLNRSEWEGLIDVAGFEVEALYGGFDRRPFDESATEFVWVVRKPV